MIRDSYLPLATCRIQMDGMEQIKERLLKAKKMIIYGAGAVANIVYLYAVQMGIENRIIAFAVSDMRGNPNCKNGLPVIQAKEILSLDRHALMIVAVQKSTQDAILSNLANLGCDDYIVLAPDALIDSFYKTLHQSPIVKNKLFFMNYNGCGYGCNPKYIAEYLRKEYGENKFDIVWGVDDSGYDIPDDIRTVQIGTYQYYSEIATSHIWIDNARKQIDIRKREGQFYIQTWHGAAPMKRVEGDIADKVPQSHINASKRDSEMADLFLSGSRFYTDLYKRAFWYDGEILEVGLPRQDIFWNIDYAKEKVKKYYHIDEDKWLVLYAPTFRDDFSADAYDLDILAVSKAIEKKFSCQCVMCVSRHPNNKHIQYNFGTQDYIDVSGYDDFEEILAAANILITDFSGCAYDFSLTGNPVFLYQKDYQEMVAQRDFYVSMEDMPYPRAETTEELVRSIFEYDKEMYMEHLESFMERFGNFDDGHASERVCERIVGILNG